MCLVILVLICWLVLCFRYFREKLAVVSRADVKGGRFWHCCNEVGERSFSEDEEQKLQSALALEKQALHLVLETSSFLLEQAVHHNIKPASLKQQLENIHIAPDKAEAFSQAWATAGPDVVEKMRQTIFAPKKLEHIGWQLNLQMGQSSQAKQKEPHAVLDLGVREEDELEHLQKVHVEFSHQELLEFYNKLEIIQTQLDSLT
ncbi:COMM domain-containing protein 10 isoform X1 [Ictalurus furcatus]|uniref:COMM domain-containing protein 10 isoform X1 n=1 Tax=Ictalurus furcatus TaxID=66913 RepID=UPI002350B5F3|nr:COMM domain-containing protein 10 isoform X1 [Ictalurus furcatus]